MKLTETCPKCGKPATIQAEFPVGNLINYVYRCGHLHLRPKIEVDKEKEVLVGVLENSIAYVNEQKNSNSGDEMLFAFVEK